MKTGRTMRKKIECEIIREGGKVIIRPKEGNDIPEFEWVCPSCGGKEYDANSLCLDCGARMISREVTKNECKGN